KGDNDGAANHLADIEAHLRGVERIAQKSDKDGAERRSPDFSGTAINTDAADDAGAYDVEDRRMACKVGRRGGQSTGQHDRSEPCRNSCYDITHDDHAIGGDSRNCCGTRIAADSIKLAREDR